MNGSTQIQTTNQPQTTIVSGGQEKGIVEYVPFGGTDKLKLSVKIVIDLIAVPTKSGKPCSTRDALRFMAMCQAKRLNPFEGDAFLIGYDANDGPVFNLITAHQTYLKRAEVHPEFDGMRSGIIVETEEGNLIDLEGDFYLPNQKVHGGWATVYFKNRKHPMHKRLRLSRFAKPFGVWKDDAAGMICKCAEADALRSAFPTMLGGLYLREEIDLIVDSTPSVPNGRSASATRPKFDGPDEPEQLSQPRQEESVATESHESSKPTEASHAGSQNASEQAGQASTTQPAQTVSEPALPDDPRLAIAELMRRSNVTEEEVVAYLQVTKFLKADQKTVGDLSTSKCESIVKGWRTHIGVILGRRTEQKG